MDEVVHATSIDPHPHVFIAFQHLDPRAAGGGTIKSSSTICYEILSEVKKVGSDMDGAGVLLRVNPDIARALKEEERNVVKDLKQLLGKDVIVKPDVHLHHEQFDVMAIGG